MPEKEALTTGGQANANFVAKMRSEHPELTDSILEGCQGCSAAWSHADRGTATERLAICPGRAEIELGGTAIMACHLPKFVEAKAST